ncbi:hypothetical protein B5G41_10865 [Alistipes onderdonkii]|uniref:Uncharacterized protein n=1 Tax=Alistipes onderdonkii TaxID=328813 RepID=A0A1Y3QSG7_9BACT|nr:hypothetical protein B5G41_10865 [Alistipes onderdonkii]
MGAEVRRADTGGGTKAGMRAEAGRADTGGGTERWVGGAERSAGGSTESNFRRQHRGGDAAEARETDADSKAGDSVLNFLPFL